MYHQNHPPQALTSNSGLQSLLLDTNAMGDEGAAMLATVRALCTLGTTHWPAIGLSNRRPSACCLLHIFAALQQQQ